MAHTDTTVRVRFAPSPTGFVHIGSLRTALFSFLFARHHGGVNILRIEDTDQNRFMEGAVENLLKVMNHMGIEFDEGFYLGDDGHVHEKGEYGPYLQSKRLDLYKKYALELIEKGYAYYCFCSEERLDEVRKEQVALKKPPMYDRHCRNLSQDEIAIKQAEFKSQGKHPIIRQVIPTEGQTIVHDLIYGDITFDNKVLDDQIILKSDGFPTYHLAVVIDDHFMEISHVTRGEDWINSTPKHILLYQALGWEPTKFAHFPNILNADKKKLSKRQGDVAVEDFLAKGYMKEALLNFVAFLGWNPKTDKEVFTLEELIGQFELSKVNKSGAIFDPNKLDWLNGLYIRQKPLGELVDLLLPYWQEAGIDTTKYPKQYFEAIANLERERLKKLSEIGERTQYFFHTPNCDPQMLVWKKSTAGQTKDILNKLHDFLEQINDSNFSKENLETHIKSFIEQNGLDNGSVLWPMRAALTGLEKSPGPFDVAAVLALGLGKSEVLQRIQAATEKLN